MKILFLDFDGVLNHDRLFNAKLVDEVTFFDRAAVARVNTILAQSGAKVVVSSSWRHAYDVDALRAILESHGFSGEIVGVTPELHRPRGLEICAWLEEHEHVETFVIVDDEDDMFPVADRLVQTSFEEGLLDEHVEAALRLLGAR
jgi:hypothetical protein